MALACRLNLDSPTEELSESFARSWDAEYSSYFSWVVRPLFKVNPVSLQTELRLIFCSGCSYSLKPVRLVLSSTRNWAVHGRR